MEIKSIKTVKNLKHKKILIRLDLDIPEDGYSNIVNHIRFINSLPTIRFLIRKKAHIYIIAHRGRPKGVKNADLTLEYIARALYRVLNGKGFRNLKLDMFPAFYFEVSGVSVHILENIRFFAGEERCSRVFAKSLSKLGDLYINDAFGVSHRSHASVALLPYLLPAYAGIHLEKEFKVLSKVFERPKRPLTVVFGGIKVKTKLSLIHHFLPRVDYILCGSGIAVQIYNALGFNVGGSYVDKESEKIACKLAKKPYSSILSDKSNFNILLDKDDLRTNDWRYLNTLKNRILLPVDIKIGRKGEKGIIKDVYWTNKSLSPNPYAILDIGPATVELYKAVIKRSGTIIWNGPMGMFEEVEYAKGSIEIAKAVAESRAKAIIGGGDTIDLIEGRHIKIKRNVFISSGGGAMLEFLLNPNLPGIKPLIKKI